MSNSDDFGANYAAEQLRRSRHPLRKMIKSFYLKNILHDVTGRTIDFGYGAGQLLACIPEGSVGLEVNSHLVTALRASGLNSQKYDNGDNFSFIDFLQGQYKTFVMAHVLEHFADADEILRKILHSCSSIGIERVIIVVPGAKGYRSDKTHKTFVNRDYLEEHGLLSCEGYTAREISYFPINNASIGEYFIFHELKLIYETMSDMH